MQKKKKKEKMAGTFTLILQGPAVYHAFLGWPCHFSTTFFGISLHSCLGRLSTEGWTQKKHPLNQASENPWAEPRDSIYSRLQGGIIPLRILERIGTWDSQGIYYR